MVTGAATVTAKDARAFARGVARWIVMRHAHAQPGGLDIERPLSQRGRDEARAMGAWLRKNGWLPERVLCSPALRCRQTTEHVLAAAGAEPDVVIVDRLYQGAAPSYLDALRGSPAATTLLVGHLPTVADVLQALAPEAARSAEGHLMAPGTAACFDGGRLVALQRPDGMCIDAGD